MDTDGNVPTFNHNSQILIAGEQLIDRPEFLRISTQFEDRIIRSRDSSFVDPWQTPVTAGEDMMIMEEEGDDNNDNDEKEEHERIEEAIKSTQGNTTHHSPNKWVEMMFFR